MLFALLAILLLKVFGVGVLASLSLSRVCGWPSNAAQWAFWCFSHGALIHYLFFLAGLNLQHISLLTLALGLLGLLSLSVFRPPFLHSQQKILLAGGLIALLFLLHFLLTPVEGHDGRLIWFAQAKWMANEGSLWIPSVWNSPELSFSHPDYPKLIPSLAAHTSYLTGYWNEYVPKFALLFAILPCIFGFLSFYQRDWLFALFMLLCFARMEMWLWYGLMDGYLALLCGVAVLMIMRFFSPEGQRSDFYSAVLALALIGCLKNEGLLAALTIVFCAAVYFLKFREARAKILRVDLFAALLYAAPIVAWQILRKQWGLQVDYRLDQKTWDIGSQRVINGAEMWNIFRHFLSDNHLGRLLIAIALLGWWHSRSARGEARQTVFVFPFLVALLYWAGMTLIYVISPFELEWHLVNSVDRTTLPIVVFLLITGYLMVKPATPIKLAESARK